MNILIISFFFPPHNIVGAVRVGKMAKFLERQGHDLRVLCAENNELRKTLPLECDSNKVFYTKWIDVDILRRVFLKMQRQNRSASGINAPYSDTKNANFFKGFLTKVKRVNDSLLFPDPQIGWYPFALHKGRKILRLWKPDVIYASALPYTSLLIAKKLSSEFNIPWVAEFRDLWRDNHYRDFLPFRDVLDSKLEKKTLFSAKGIVTVSDVSTETMSLKYSIPCKTIMNGFDSEDYEGNRMVPDHKRQPVLRIVYTGNIYRDKRDPSILFQAIQKNKNLKNKIIIDFYGAHFPGIREKAMEFGCSSCVQINGMVPYLDSLRIQQNADILLLLLWDTPEEKGVYTGKFFEYLGSGRPILVIGSRQNVASEYILKHSLGFVSRDPDEIASELEFLLNKKMRGLSISPEYHGALRDFSRARQAEVLANFLENLIRR